MANTVAIVGRPNVGKSTLYNRLLGERDAIVNDFSGVTRDRIYGVSDWNGKSFTVIDTGGFVRDSEDVFEAAIREQVKIAINEASMVIFMCDVATGITDLDAQIADMLRRSSKPVFLVVNKVDNANRTYAANEFWSLGFDNTFFLSSISGSGTGELLDAMSETMEAAEVDPEEVEVPVLAIVGQPNVGKSTLTNAFLGEERNIVTDIAGTTRDSILTHFKKFSKEFYLIDTAGMRKKAKVHEDLEFYSVIRAIKAVDKADVCFLMIDAVDGIENQDLQIFQLAVRRKKGVIIVVNKWDLVDKETNTARDFELILKGRLAPFNDVPVHFISALNKQRVFKLIDSAIEVYNNKTKQIKTSVLNEFLQKITEKVPPPSHRGKFVKLKYITQLSGRHPIFGIFCNHPQHIKENYRNYIENQFREEFDFKGVPISLVFKKK